MIEKKAGKTISEIFNLSGESEFRKIEKEILNQIININDDIVVATGGGTPCFFENMETMNHYGTTFYLKLAPGLLLKRIKSETEKRPLILRGEKPLSIIRKMLAERKKYYESSNYTLLINEDETEKDICKKLQIIIKKLKDHAENI